MGTPLRSVTTTASAAENIQLVAREAGLSTSALLKRGLEAYLNGNLEKSATPMHLDRERRTLGVYIPAELADRVRQRLDAEDSTLALLIADIARHADTLAGDRSPRMRLRSLDERIALRLTPGDLRLLSQFSSYASVEVMKWAAGLPFEGRPGKLLKRLVQAQLAARDDFLANILRPVLEGPEAPARVVETAYSQVAQFVSRNPDELGMLVIGPVVPLLLLAALISGRSPTTEITPRDATVANVLDTALESLAAAAPTRELEMRETELRPAGGQATAADLLLDLFSRLAHWFLAPPPAMTN